MEPVLKQSGKVMGIEVLYFEEAQLRKVKGDKASFAAIGPLSVLYFKDYQRFVLHLNDWRYPLMRRLPITASSKDALGFRSYSLPTLNGYTFELRISSSVDDSSIENFETILGHCSNFSLNPRGKIEASPDDKVSRYLKKDTTTMNVISQMLKNVTERSKITIENLQHGTKVPSKVKGKIDLKDIKTKDFKKDAHSTFKKDFFESSERLHQEFLKLRRENPNLTQSMEFDDLKKTNHHKAPSVYLWKEEVEEAILRNKDLITQGGFDQVKVEERKGIIGSIREGLGHLRDTITHRVEARNVVVNETKTESTIEHSQG